MSTLLDAAEAALTAYLNAQPLSVTAVLGISTATKTDPVVVCTAQEWEVGEEGANADLLLVIEIKASSPATFKTLCQEVETALNLEDAETLGTQIQQAGTGITVWGAKSQPSAERETTDDLFIERRALEMHCALTA